MRRVAPDCGDRRLRAQPRRRRVRLRSRVLRRDADRVRGTPTRASYRQITDGFARWTDIDIHYRGEMTRSGGHGFSALGRKELLGILQQPGAGARRGDPVSDRGAGRGRAGRRVDLVIAADGVNSAVRGAARRATSGPSLDPPPLQVHVAGHRPRLRRLQVLHRRDRARASSRSTAIPYDARDEHVHRRERRGDVARAPGSTRPRGAVPPGRERRGEHRVLPRAVRRHPAGHKLVANNSQWLNFTTVRNAHWSRTTTSCCSATRRTPRTSRSARGRSWRWRTRSRWPGRSGARRRRPGGARGLRGRAPADRGEHAARRPGEPRVVRGDRALRRPARPQFAFNLLTRSRRITYDNLRLRDAGFVDVDELFRGRDGPARARRCSRRSGCAAWSCPTGSSSRRWTCTPRSTARRLTSTSCISAAGRVGGAALV